MPPKDVLMRSWATTQANSSIRSRMREVGTRTALSGVAQGTAEFRRSFGDILETGIKDKPVETLTHPCLSRSEN
jgi:hypothetical protein